MSEVIEHPCLILYRSATGLERALVDVGGGRLIAMPAELIRDMWDAARVSDANLPVLAWAMQAQLWDDDWPDATKRAWVAQQWLYQSLRGTRAGVAMALRFMGRDFTGGYDLIDVLTAPQGFYAVPDDADGPAGFAGADRVGWPPYNAELLIDLKTHDLRPGWYCDDAFVGDAFVIPDDLTDYDRALKALKGPGASTSLRDKIMADFAISHPLRMREPVFDDPETRFGDQRPSWL